MKKNILLFVLLFLSFTLFSESNILGSDFSVFSAIPFYNSNEVSQSNSNVSENPNRIVIGTGINLTVKIVNQLKLFAGSSVLCDFNWNGSDYSNHLDYDFSFGAKIYPNLMGFNFGISYILGQRADFVDNKINKRENSVTSWGNGFKIFAEYDFKHNSERKSLPIIGFFYKFIPRGNYNNDNYLGFYAGLAF